MKARNIATLLIIGALSGVLPASGSTPSIPPTQLVGVVHMVTSPLRPLEGDEITLVFSGEWNTPCVPTYRSHTLDLDRNRIIVEAVADDPPEACPWESTPWELAVPIGHLSAGYYVVSLRISSWRHAIGFILVSIGKVYLPLTAQSADATIPPPP